MNFQVNKEELMGLQLFWYVPFHVCLNKSVRLRHKTFADVNSRCANCMAQAEDIEYLNKSHYKPAPELESKKMVDCSLASTNRENDK